MSAHRCRAAAALLAIGLLLPAPVRPEPVPERRPRPGRAAAISWTATLAPAALGAAAFGADSPEIGWMLLATGVLFGPATGYLYGGRPGRGMAGAGTRVAFGALGTVGVGQMFTESSDAGSGPILFVLGGIGVLVSLIWDLAAVGPTVRAGRGARGRPPFPDFVAPYSVVPSVPMSVWEGDVNAARVFDQMIPRDSLGQPGLGKEERGARLAGMVWASLVKRYMAEQGIEATPDDVEQFRLAPGTSAWLPAGTREDSIAAARGAVLQWKLNRSLYERYGGDVIRRPLDPLEPIGAYRAFLEAMERRRVFEIYEPGLGREFWRRFSTRSLPKVPAAQVDFDTPWWLQAAGGAPPTRP